MRYLINNEDITKWIAYGGVKWQRADVDGPNAGRTLDGTMVRDRRATKYRWDITCVPLNAADLSKILGLIQGEFVTFTYTDPLTNTEVSDLYYANNFPAQLTHIYRNGEQLWTGLTFPLIQR